MHFTRPALIHNPVGGSANPTLKNEILSTLARTGAFVQEYATGPEPNSARAHAEFAIASGADMLIAMGGDGTALEVAEAAMAANIPFAAYQGGTSNQFASSFYPKLPPKEFCQMLVEGRVQKIDVLELDLELDGKKETRRALVGVATGRIAEAISYAPRFWKRIFGPLVYFLRVLVVCFNPRPQLLRFRSEDREWSSRVSTAAIFNVDRTPVVRLAPACNASDGLLDLVEVKARNIFEMLVTGFWLLVGRNYRAEQFAHRRLEELYFESDEPISLNVDGEPATADRVRVCVLKGALSMIVSH